MVLLIVAVVVGALTPAVVRQISRARVNRAATIVAADFMQAQSMAGRQQQPIRIVFDATNRTVALTQQSGSTISTRQLGTGSEFKLTTLSATVSPVLVLPSGMASSVVTVTVGAPGYTRQVRMSRAGQVRVL